MTKQQPKLTPEQIAALPWISRAIIKLAAMMTPSNPADAELRKSLRRIRRRGPKSTNHIYRNMPFK